MCYSLKYTGKKEDFIDCLNLLQKYYIEDGEVNLNDLSNVRSSDTSLDSLKDTEFKEGDIYIFSITWHEYCDSYDTYYWKLWSAEQAFDQINKVIKESSKVFATSIAYGNNTFVNSFLSIYICLIKYVICVYTTQYSFFT